MEVTIVDSKILNSILYSNVSATKIIKKLTGTVRVYDGAESQVIPLYTHELGNSNLYVTGVVKSTNNIHPLEAYWFQVPYVGADVSDIVKATWDTTTVYLEIPGYGGWSSSNYTDYQYTLLVIIP